MLKYVLNVSALPLSYKGHKEGPRWDLNPQPLP